MLTINDIPIEDTFAEAFPMTAARLIVTAETAGEIADMKPGGESDLLTVFMPTGIVPPQGFICFLPRKDVTFLSMSVEEAAKLILSAGIVVPDMQGKLKELAAVPANVRAPASKPQRPAKI